jgi:hypothetical protein
VLEALKFFPASPTIEVLQITIISVPYSPHVIGVSGHRYELSNYFEIVRVPMYCHCYLCFMFQVLSKIAMHMQYYCSLQQL